MSDLRNWRHASTKSIITLAGCIVAAATILIYFLPRESKFGYTYETDKPWRYEQLIASYDFPIAKSEVEMQRERDSVARTFEPYYITDSLAGEEQVAALQADFSAGRFKGLPAYYLPRLVELLRKVYAQGVINAPERSRLQAAGKKNIRRIKGKMSVAKPVKDLFTRREAYTYIMDRDAGSVSRNVLQNCRIDNYIVPNLHADEQKNKQELESLMAQIIANSGMVQSGQLIIDRGQIVTPHHTRILDSLKKESERRMDPSRGYWMILAGQAVYVFVCISLLLTYLKLFRRVMALLSAVTLHNPFEFVLLQLVTGLAAIYSLRELTERSQLLRTVLAVVCAGLLVSFTYDLSQGLGSQAFDQSRTVYVVIGGILLLFAYPLMYLVERVFGFTSSVTLVELTNINNSLLRRMSKVAQGTFNHSMQVANLAAEVADKIGAKPQMVRTGALYHDIGKMLNPAFFTENQTGVNPHDQLSEERSAQIIISHVTDGLRLADKHHLPSVIKDFIRTHHGAGLVKYFYIQYANKHPEEEVDKQLFSYPGPNPRTREQGILMMCDAVEAASRSLKEYTEESLSGLVNHIIDSQLADGCFKECPLTFRDIADAKRVLIDSLKTIYHTRISYPEMKKTQQGPTQPAQGFFATGIHRTWQR